MTLPLPIRQGLASATVKHIPKNWDPEWFRHFISAHLKAADARNTIAGPGITITGTSPYPGTISASGVPVTSLAPIPPFTIIGNNTAFTVTPQTLSEAQVTAMIQEFTSTTSGAVPPSGAATSIDFLNADGMWVPVPTGAISPIPAFTIIGNDTAAIAVPQDLTETQVTAMLNLFTSSLQGMVPASGGGTVNFLRADGTWDVPSGGGGSSTTPTGAGFVQYDCDDPDPPTTIALGADPATGVVVSAPWIFEPFSGAINFFGNASNTAVIITASNSGGLFGLQVLGGAEQYAAQFIGSSAGGESYGVQINAGFNASDYALYVQNYSKTAEYLGVRGDGHIIATSSPLTGTLTQVETGVSSHLTADFTITNNATPAATGLSLTFNETGTYEVEMWVLFYESATATDGIKTLFGGTATETGFFTYVGEAVSGTIVSAVATAWTNGFAFATVSTSSTGPSTLMIRGNLTVTATGTLIFEASQNTASSGSTLHVMAGSYMTATKIG
jgi:hypothetical protein